MSGSRTVQVRANSSLLPLKYPQSVAVFETYDDAQKAVDYLADQRFAVENLCIVGTDLKLVERVLGRRSWGQVLAGGALSGIGTGLLVGLFMYFLYPSLHIGTAMLGGLVIGVAMGVLSSAMAQSVNRGQRDFNSVTSTVATHYEVLGEHNVVQKARDLLQKMPGARVAVVGGAPYGGYPSGYPQQYPQPGQQPYSGQYAQPYPQGQPGQPGQSGQPGWGYPQPPYPQQAYQPPTYPAAPASPSGGSDSQPASTPEKPAGDEHEDRHE